MSMAFSPGGGKRSGKNGRFSQRGLYPVTSKRTCYTIIKTRCERWALAVVIGTHILFDRVVGAMVLIASRQQQQQQAKQMSWWSSDKGYYAVSVRTAIKS